MADTAKTKVTIIGCTGMLGSIVLDSLFNDGDFDIGATHRASADKKSLVGAYPSVSFEVIDAETASVEDISNAIKGSKWVINAAGIIKPYIHDDNAAEVERAILVNSLFPHRLGDAATKVGANVIQIATDCVYSGQKGDYIETDVHDALDVYGKSKSLGEAYFENIYHVRCSIIGPELKGHLSLLDWFLGNPQNADLNGFSNHQWNGITTLQFAKIARGIIKANLSLPHAQHIVPGNIISKADLLKTFAKAFKRPDITIKAMEAPTVIDRTLTTNNDSLNRQIWQSAGYNTPPTIEQMVLELAEYGSVKVAKK
ncbi:MAG TPA: sugar nucleotide-binding protein [Candidatus Saccharimonadales bacterium]|nr:sugar nucleotide-binding protein [Candidatus Saccharimonadales bacterium]